MIVQAGLTLEAAAEEERAVILTPKSSPQPRINSAKVFGVRPGHLFLFTIPATGDRPMTFSAKGLPAGLTVDARTGQITGSIQKAGHMPLTAGKEIRVFGLAGWFADHYRGVQMVDLVHASRGCRFNCFPCCVRYLGGRSFRPRPWRSTANPASAPDTPPAAPRKGS